MARDLDSEAEERLLQNIHRFPELYPASIGGLRDDLHVPTRAEVDAVLCSEGGEVQKQVLTERRKNATRPPEDDRLYDQREEPHDGEYDQRQVTPGEEYYSD
jgi:hypothetical protein